MERKQVSPSKSSQIRSVGYDPVSQTLEIEFSSGGVYDYSGVPEGAYEDFIHADSLGQFVATRIRGQYEYTRQHIESCSGWHQIEDCQPSCTCWCHKLTKTSRETESPIEKEKPKKTKKARKA